MYLHHGKHHKNSRLFIAGLAGGAILLFTQPIICSAQSESWQPTLAQHAKAAILMDAGTGTVLFSKNEHTHLPIASVTKVMTMLLIFEAIDKRQVHLYDTVRVSDHAASMGGSQIFLKPGESMTLSDLMKGIAMASANDAAVAVAEHVAGSEANFIRKMNDKAHQLGLHDSHFVNTNGLPAPQHYSSAYDVAIISKELLNHEGVTRFSGSFSDHLRKNTAKPFWLVNTNKLVRFYQGMDGVKTGYTSESLYCLSASAKRGDLRMIAVVLGEPSSVVRNAEVVEMMNYAFSQYSAKSVFKKGQVVTLVPVSKGESTAVAAIASRTVTQLIKKDETRPMGQVITEIHPLKAPVKKGQVVGHVVVLFQGRTTARVPLLAVADVQPVSWWEMLGRSLHKMFLLGVKE